MNEEKTCSDADARKKFAVDLFNRTWELIEQKDRTDEETELMIHSAHASCYHWSVVGTALHRQRGEWLIARVYCLLNRPEAASHHARVCLGLTESNGFKDFDLAFAYEAMARAGAASGNRGEFEKYSVLAEQAAAGIREQGDRDYFRSDLKGGDWFGMK